MEDSITRFALLCAKRAKREPTMMAFWKSLAYYSCLVLVGWAVALSTGHSFWLALAVLASFAPRPPKNWTDPMDETT